MWIWLLGSISSCGGAPSTPAADKTKVVPATAGGGHELTPQEIRARVMGQLPALRRCYEVEFNKGQGTAEGSATFSWKIAPSGSVSEVSGVGSSPGASATVLCAVGEIKKWKFPRSATSNNVSWPFHWGTSSPDGGV